MRKLFSIVMMPKYYKGKAQLQVEDVNNERKKDN
tara:strand:- start:4231 stop:4332 length:102 start_codon:yes stop_codon:yes gene_type:complete